MRHCLIFLFATIITATTFANQTPPAPAADLYGGTIDADNKSPLSNVSVTIISEETKEKKQVVTDNNGSFYFNDIKPGTYKIIFQKNGFRKVTKEKISLKENDNYQLNVEMDDVDDFQLFPRIFLVNDDEK